MGPAGRGKDLRQERPRASAAHDDCSPDAAGHARHGELPPPSIPAREDRRPRGFQGGVPGLWLAHEHPDVVAAYVGVGQAVDLGLNTKTAYEDALAVARTRGLNDAVHELEALRPYPDPAN